MNFMELSLSDVGHKLFFHLVAPKGNGCFSGCPVYRGLGAVGRFV